ncbi:ester cyclase [Actinoplanes sp. L3-i22]|uniref:ester cyclase n=1 Tax=Actinoplanes sp. L3-i22 TaxID=2836373 RepID=UPI001C798604|nr:ester cyclase [Actinoplanes sp. L3-i22]BCY10228.1 hypothetical protein L3i22_053160 [Actinoplanes sp. L3-i22]
MSAENIAAFHRFHDAVESRDPETIAKVVEETFHPDARFHTAEPGGVPAVPAQNRIWRVLFRAYPDLRVTIDELLAVDDKIVARQTVTGTNTGEYRGRPASGRRVTYQEIFIARFDDGRITDLWGVVDLYTQLSQLGHIRE